MQQMLTSWAPMLAAACYAMLAIWRMAISRDHPGSNYLALAFAGMSAWNITLWSDVGPLILAAEVLKELGWLGYFLGTTRSLKQYDEVRRRIRIFSACLLFLLVARTALILGAMSAGAYQGSFSQLLLAAEWIYALTGIFFAHYLYRSTVTSGGTGFRLITVMLGASWAYSLNVFTLLLLGYREGLMLSSFEGIVSLLLVPVFALAARRKENWRVALSRQATTQSLLLIALGTYFVIISTASRTIDWASYHTGAFPGELIVSILVTGLVFGLGVLPRFRALLKAFLVRNLFEHRYDYRSEWLRFSSTMGEDKSPGQSVEERAIRSMADVTESVGGALLTLDGASRVSIAATLDWPAQTLFGRALRADPVWIGDLALSGRVITLDEVRARSEGSRGDANVPDWLVGERHAWALVPLVRADQLVAMVVLGRPRFERELDWEDFDLLKVIAEQVAVHLADARSQMELEEARHFEEFNRRFAFIIHDIKNVVSQLSLVSRNAVEHGSNPKFQASMALTLDNATSKMSTLLARLSSQRVQIDRPLTDVRPSVLLWQLAGRDECIGRVTVSVERECIIRADEEQLLEALGHLLSNALDASDPQEMVLLSLTASDQNAVIGVKDHGCGMSAQFIQTDLFKAFASTKPNGFGIGAAEARALIDAMGGDLDVNSAEGQGTHFIIKFPIQSPEHDES